MVELNAKKSFLAQTETAQAFRTMAHGDVLHTAITHAMFEFADANPTQEQLVGANRFRDILLNLGEPEMPPPTFPDKPLKHDLVAQPEPPSPDKKKGKK
jgi:hypothetical protein